MLVLRYLYVTVVENENKIEQVICKKGKIHCISQSC